MQPPGSSLCAAVTGRERGRKSGLGFVRGGWHLRRPVSGGTRDVREINKIVIIPYIINF